MGILLDPISVMMIVVVTFVSLMVHIYSLGYMKGEERYATYYSFLSLFTFSMLGLVLSTNIFQTYIFWELVGVSSFLLIGYYYNKPSAVAAAKKAFIVTRFADLGSLIGILILSFYSETLDFVSLTERLTTPGSPFAQSASSATFLGISALTWGLTTGVHWRSRQIRDVSFACLVAGCHGKHNTCFRSHPCSYHGCRWCV